MVSQSDTSYEQLSRDLRWIQNSPVLFNQDCHDCFTSRVLTGSQQPLSDCGPALDSQQADHIRATLSKKRWHLLGIYYETLWHYLLEQHPAIEILARNLQIQKADRSTLGEFDLIYKHLDTSETVHLELAVKFYLGIPGSLNQTCSPWHQWVGPGLKDRMDRKLHRLLHHQITLSQTVEGQAAIATLGIRQLTRRICLHGYLFYPVHGDCQPPEHCNPDHLKGYWIAEPELYQWLSNQRQALFYFRPGKLRWLASLHESTDQQPYDRDKLCQALSAISEPELVVACHQHVDGYYEHSRFFVIPDGWQEKAVIAANSPG